MPIYEYKCAKCGYKTEKFHPRMDSNHKTIEKHPNCDNKRLNKIISKSLALWKCDTGTN